MKQYREEARRRFGDTDAYREYERRMAGCSDKAWDDISDGMDTVMEGFAALQKSGVKPDEEQAHSQVEKLKGFITERLYTCTDETLAGLGQMYVADERFTENIDRHGEGTAAYVSACIKSYTA